MRAYLLPFGDLIAWCLMPNHFHWQFYVKRTSVERRFLRGYSDNVEYQRRLARYGEKAMEVDKKATRMADENEAVELNEAIGTLLKAYAKAINKEKGMSGSVFRKNCKAKDGWIDEFVSSEFLGKENYPFSPDTDYAYFCFSYIHENPVEARIVKRSVDYPWSSAKDYAGLRKGSLCNLEMGRKLYEQYGLE